MVLVPAGTFTMGRGRGSKMELPAHPVSVSRPFHIDVHEVTSGEYATCVLAGRCQPTSIHRPGAKQAEIDKFTSLCTALDPKSDRHPINCVDRAQAGTYCAFVGKRLPTEAEWEYAARGSDAREYPWGNDAPACAHGHIGGVSGAACVAKKFGPTAVGQFPAGKSAAGALDMSGNVWEWVTDNWDDNPTTTRGVLRGGSWDFSTDHSRATSRLNFDFRAGHVSTGFRCVK